MATAAVVMPSMATSSIQHNDQQTRSQMPSIKARQAEIENESPSKFLIQHIAHVLKLQGKNARSIAEVSELVSTNTVTASAKFADASDDTAALNQLIFGDLLNDEKLQSHNLKINSNEPVLLLEFDMASIGGHSHAESIRQNLLDILRGVGVKPVRVYIRNVEDDAAEGEWRDLNVVLLNVVNTNLGGPSMVQLLDAAFHGEDWKQQLVVKEAWNGYDLLWRDEAWPDTSGLANPTSAQASRTDQGASEEPKMPKIEQPQSEIQKDSADILTEQGGESLLTPEAESQEEAAATPLHPAMRELQEREANRAQIQYPTWSRTHDDEALLDIITSQSGGVKDEQPLSVISRPESNKSEDFEVIENPVG